MIGEEFIQFLEIGIIAVLLVLLLQSIHSRRGLRQRVLKAPEDQEG